MRLTPVAPTVAVVVVVVDDVAETAAVDEEVAVVGAPEPGAPVLWIAAASACSGAE